MGNYLSGYLGGLYISRAESDWDLRRARNQASTMSEMDDNTHHTSDNSTNQDPSDIEKMSKGKRLNPEDKSKNSQAKVQKCEDSSSTNMTKVTSSLVTSKTEMSQHQEKDNYYLDISENQQNKSGVEIDKFATSRKGSKIFLHDGACNVVFGSGTDKHTSGIELEMNTESFPNPGSHYLHINGLPTQLLVHVFTNLTLSDLLRTVCLVSKYWYDVAHDPVLWRDINLRGQMKADDEVLRSLTSYSESVSSIDISDARSLTDEGVVTMSKRCSGIRDLKMIRCIQLKEEAFMSLGQHCPMIVSLYLDCCFSLSNEALQMIGSGCPRLKVLHINQCSRISDQGIEAIGRGCACLEEISMDQCKQVGDGGLARLVEGCTQLKRLSAMSCVFTSSGITRLMLVEHLERLELHDVLGVNDECMMAVVASCRELQTLNVALCTQITDRGLDVIAKRTKNLKSIYLASCDITDKALVSLGAHCKKLESVDVGWCSQITDAGVVALSETCPTLQNLGLIKCDKVTIQTMDQLVETFPKVHYSTFWLDCRRLMERAKRMGYAPAAPFTNVCPSSGVHPSS